MDFGKTDLSPERNGLLKKEGLTVMLEGKEYLEVDGILVSSGLSRIDALEVMKYMLKQHFHDVHTTREYRNQCSASLHGKTCNFIPFRQFRP